MDEKVWQITTHRPPNVKTVEVYGIGTVYMFENGIWSLLVPSKRGHEHYVPCNMEWLAHRLVVFNSRPEKITRWNNMIRPQIYTKLEDLAEDIYKLYDGQGIFVQDAQGQSAVLLSLPTDDIVITLASQSQTLYKQENMLLFYPHTRIAKLLSPKQQNLKEFSLLDGNYKDSLHP